MPRRPAVVPRPSQDRRSGRAQAFAAPNIQRRPPYRCMVDLDDAMGALGMLRVASRGGARLPYQPLVLLWAVERTTTQATRLSRWSRVRADLAAMLAAN